MKVCTNCGIAKEESDYFFKIKKIGKLHSQCKVCYSIKRATYMQQHYEKYGDAYRRRARERKHLVKRQSQERLLNFLSDKSCEDCDFSDIRVLDFDHIEPSLKSFGIARAVNEGYSWAKIQEEIAKCRIVCANCHRIRTANQYNWYRKARWPRS